MRVHSIINTSDGVEVTYSEEADIDIDAGVITTHSVRLAQEAIDQELIDEYEQLAKEFLDIARRRRFGVADEFKAANR